MHEHLGSLKQISSQKFCKNLIKLEKPKIFQQTPKVRSQKMKCIRKEWKRIIPEKGSDLETKERVGKWFGVRKRCLGRWEVRKDRDRSRRNKRNDAQILYIEILVSQWIERCQELPRIKTQEITIKELSRGVHNK